MTVEELFKKNFPQYVTEKGKCLSPFWDLFSAGYETGKDEAEADLATVAYMQGAERYKGELAKREEQIEALNKDKDYFSNALDKQIEVTYKVVEENAELKKRNGELAGQKASLERWFGEAKAIIKDLLCIPHDMAYEELNSGSWDIVYKAEAFLKEE